jgi:hypothetical protein
MFFQHCYPLRPDSNALYEEVPRSLVPGGGLEPPRPCGLDHLARNVNFISNLMEAGVKSTAVDFPQANRLTIHILAAVAEHEAVTISSCTKAALATAKARGTRLGNPRRRSGERCGTQRQSCQTICRPATNGQGNRGEWCRVVTADRRRLEHSGNTSSPRWRVVCSPGKPHASAITGVPF